MSIDVTVVVPVYNPGPNIEVCIEGYLRQTMPQDRREIIFVNDGSTDDTPERLDRLAAEHPGVHVVHQPNSGWPGKPRNVGIDAAQGEYVFFCDQDDGLGPKALDLMVAMARRTGADVLVPKIVGHQRPSPHLLFRKNIDHAVLGEDPLMTAMTPHKMLRRAFLLDHGLRFPEGRRRLEDQAFVIEAYLLAKAISVLSDYPCYHRMRRADGGNAALQPWEASYYFRFVSEAIDVIYDHTEPGQLRNTLLRRPYAKEMLGKLRERKALSWDHQAQKEVFDEVRTLAIDRFAADFHEQFAVAIRAHAQAIVADRLDQLQAVARDTAAAGMRAAVHDLTWSGSGWLAQIEVELVLEDGSPIRLTPDAEGWSVDPRLIPASLDAGPYDRETITNGHIDVTVRHRTNDVEWFLETSILPELIAIAGDQDGAHRLIYRGTVQIDPATAAGGRPLARGSWDVVLRVEVLGIHRTPFLDGSSAVSTVLLPPALILPVQRFVRPVIHAGGRNTLVLKVAKLSDTRRSQAVLALARARDVGVTHTGDLVATMQLPRPGGAPDVECRAILVNGAQHAPHRLGRLNKAAVGGLMVNSLRATPSGKRSRAVTD